MRALFASLALLLVLLTPIPALAEPLQPAYYLPTDAEMLSGFELTQTTGPEFNHPGTGYQEIRTYTRAAPFALVVVIAGISPDQTTAHERLGGLVGSYASNGFLTMPGTQADESTMLWRIGPELDTYSMIWRQGSLLGSVALVCPTGSMSSHDAGYQSGLVARPMLDRMAAHPDDL